MNIQIVIVCKNEADIFQAVRLKSVCFFRPLTDCADAQILSYRFFDLADFPLNTCIPTV